ncbi:4989_t:CDS:2 [Diversispora eburnea]|uniref:4989_t:CDS:1 n=1 Tax=Diversispora eburnea TaxID=1213867 RepID=A0A9N9AM01_9GLOM|nr:4989_t:CDS:2 [Diversispora eburnea]
MNPSTPEFQYSFIPYEISSKIVSYLNTWNKQHDYPWQYNREDNEIEMVLFVSNNLKTRDSETQAIFKKDRFYSVGKKIVSRYYGVSTGLTIFNKVPNSNKCLLMISLVGVPQELSQVVEDDENAVLNILIDNYVGQDLDSDIKVIFQYLNSWFISLKSIIHSLDLFIFVLGQLKVINNDFYIYTKDINCISTQSLLRRNSDDKLYSLSKNINKAWSKLIATHCNIIENQRESSEVGISSSVVLNNENTFSSKCVKIELANKSISVFNGVKRSNDKINKTEAMAKRGRHKKNICNDKKGKGYVSRFLHNTSKLNIDSREE